MARQVNLLLDRGFRGTNRECGGGVDGGTKIETLNEKSCRWMTDVRWVVCRSDGWP